MSSKTETSASSNSTADASPSPLPLKAEREHPGCPSALNTGEENFGYPSPLGGEGRGEEAISARCSHFGECGGCQFQDLDYSAQLVRKAEFIGSILKPAGWNSLVPIHPSPSPWYYRNKMEFSFQDVYPKPAPEEDYLLLGLKRRKRWDKVLNISECYLMSPETPKLIAAVHQWARDHALEPYNLHRKTGFLRHLVVREGKATGERMVLLVTSPGELPRESFVSAVRAAYAATTILWGVNGRVADVARTDGLEKLCGPGYITETVLGKRFRISPYSFFQTNSVGAAELYRRIRDWIEELRVRNVLDLYCGSGGITLPIADSCDRLIGVELVASAVEDARANAEANGIKNVEFIESKAEEVLPALGGRNFKADAVIVDPPRCGLHPTAAKDLLYLRPAWMIYVSCNPKALARDLEQLAPGYDVQRVEAVDLFPHTEHVETLALLKSKPQPVIAA